MSDIQAEAVYAGIDVGGTNIVCGLTDAAGRLLRTLKRPTEAGRGGDALVDKLDAAVRELLAECGVEPARLQAAGIGIPGFLDPVRGIVKSAANMNMTDYPIADKLAAKLGVPVWIDNDVRMYILGEAARGAAAGYDYVLGVTVGTGIAGAYIQRGELLYGAGSLAGEIGHVVVEGNSLVCGCGMTGCLETLVSAGGIVRQAEERMKSKPSILHEWFPEQDAGTGASAGAGGRTSADHNDSIHSANASEPMTAAHIAKAYDAGDPVAIDVFEYTGELLGKALAAPVIMMSPDIIVVGGGVSLAGDRLLSPLRRTLRERTHPMYGDRVVVAQAQLTDDAGIIGSAELARMKSEKHSN